MTMRMPREVYAIPPHLRPPDPPPMRPGLYASPTAPFVPLRPAPTSVPRPPTRYESGAFEGVWSGMLIGLVAIGVIGFVVALLRGAP